MAEGLGQSGLSERGQAFSRTLFDVNQSLLNQIAGIGPGGQVDLQQLLAPQQFPQQLFTPGASPLQQQAFQAASQFQPFSPEQSNQLFQQGVAAPAQENFQQALQGLRSSTIGSGGQTGAFQSLGQSGARGLARDLAAQQAQFQIGQQQLGGQQLSQLANIGGLQRSIAGQQGQEQFNRFLGQQPFAAPNLQLLQAIGGQLQGSLGQFPSGFGLGGLGSLLQGIGGFAGQGGTTP